MLEHRRQGQTHKKHTIPAWYSELCDKGEWEIVEDGGNPQIRQYFIYFFKLMNKVEPLGEVISERGDTCANVSKL